MTQEQALAVLKSGRNVFLTGSAGTGKTFVLNQYISYLKERKVAVAVTASTGIAATHMNGMTIHSWSGIGVKEKLTNSNLRSLKTKKYLEKKFDKVKVLIIDEISMLHRNQLELVDQVLQYFKENQLPFGGIQLIVCGDFFQLPPIGNAEEKSKDKFAFMSPVWVNAAFHVCYLTEQFRQENNALNQFLGEMRSARISESSFKKLKETANNTLEDTKEPTRLYTHNYDVDAINQEALQKLDATSNYYGAKVKGNEKLVETLKKSVLAAENMELKVGAKVMFVKNIPEKGVVNGSLGKVIEFNKEKIPLVKLSDGRIITAQAENWKIQDEEGKTLAQFDQIPLRLAWAITIHKSQGMTLDYAEVDLSKTFEKGQGYVALSRLKNLESLRLLGINETALKVDSLAYKADVRFQELSAKVEKENPIEQLQKEAVPFLKKCGGITNNDEIKKHKSKLKEKSKGKTDSTYEVTYSYLKQKLPLEKIAEERGMAVGTIAGHLIKIKKDHPDANLSRYKPKKSVITIVEKLYKKQAKGEAVSLKEIYEGANGKISYLEIKLALAFII